MFILVALETFSLITNSSVLEAAGAFEDDIWWLSLPKYTAEITCILGKYNTYISNKNESRERDLKTKAV